MTLIIPHVSFSSGVCDIDLHWSIQTQFIHFRNAFSVFLSWGTVRWVLLFHCPHKATESSLSDSCTVSLGGEAEVGKVLLVPCVHHLFSGCQCCPPEVSPTQSQGLEGSCSSYFYFSTLGIARVWFLPIWCVWKAVLVLIGTVGNSSLILCPRKLLMRFFYFVVDQW